MEFIFTDNQLDEFNANIMKALAANPLIATHSLIKYFPADIAGYMTDDLVSDINDMGRCFKASLYTPGMLMAFRIFEKSINTHLEEDLRIRSNKLHLSIHHLKKTFNKDFVNRLQNIRVIRNKTTHSDKTFNRDTSFEVIEDIVWVVLFVYNIVPED